MRILLATLLIGSCVHAMDPKALSLKKPQPTNSVLSFFNSLSKTIKEVIPGSFQDSSGSEEESSSSRSSPELAQMESMVPYALHESPPKTYLDEEVVLGKPVPALPTLFHIQNKAKVGVLLVVVLTAPYRPKKYFLQPHDEFMHLAPDGQATQFQEVFVTQSEHNMHIARYAFVTDLYVKLQIREHPFIKNQLCIRENKG